MANRCRSMIAVEAPRPQGATKAHTARLSLRSYAAAGMHRPRRRKTLPFASPKLGR